MKKLFFILSLFLSSATMWADDISIPTDADHPFDLTLGTLEGKNMKINSANEIDNGRNGYKATFTLDNREAVDYLLFTFKAGTTRNDAQFHITISEEDGTVAFDRYVPLTNNGSWSANVLYSMKTDKMKKGRYTLVFDFISTGNEYVGRLADIALKKALSLKPGDEVKIVNPEFDEGNTGWTAKSANIGVADMFGNHRAVMHVNSGTMSLSQTVTSLPVGTYLLLCSAYDEAREWNGTDTLQSYVFLNDSQQLMKNAYDDAVGYRNIYRICDGQQRNTSYRKTSDAHYVPTGGHEWNQCLAMAEGFYVNGITGIVTDGKADFGWKSLDNRWKTVVFDHFRLIYLSDKTDLSTETRAAIVDEYVTAAYRARLNSQLSIVNSQLTNGKPHAPQAVAEAKAILGSDEHGLTKISDIIDASLRAEDVAQRLALPFYEATVSGASPSGLADQLATLGIQTTDTIALKLNGTLTNDDLATLKTLKNLKELDLSETTLTVLPRSQFEALYQLTWVTLPRQLETISERAFFDCIRLRDMELPATLRSIAYQSFQNCYSLDRVVIPENVSLGSSVFVHAGLRYLSLPPSLKVVPDYLCFECPDLIDIHFNGQTEIKDRAFGRCNALQKVTLPEGVEKMGSSFVECSQLASVTLPSTLVYMYGPFNKCPKLKDVTIVAACPPFGGLFDLAPDMGHAGQMEGVTVRVPRISADAYQESLFAWRFGTIEPIDTLPQSITMNGTFTFNVPDGLPADYKPDVDLRMNLLYPNSGADEVTGLQTKASLTVEGTSMLSTGHYRQLYNPYAMRSAKFHRSYHGPLYTTLVNNGQMRADEVTVALRMYKNTWEFVTFPYDVRVGDISCTEGLMPLIIYGYDCKKRAEGTGQAWVQMTADSTLHAGQGYIWQTSIPNNEKRTYPYNTFQVNALQNANKPKFFRNGDVEVTLEKHNAEFAQNRSWNFIGNPYPSFFDIRAIETTAPITVWEYGEKGGGGTYQAISPLDDDYILAPGQAFFIQCPLDHDKLVFHKEGRQHDLELQYEASRNLARAAPQAQSRQVFNLLLTESSTEAFPTSETLDRTRFVINEAASLDYEPGRDASKFAPLDAEATQLYTVRNGVRYAIDERPLSDGTVRLGLRLPAAATYTLALATVPVDSPAGSIILIDRETNTETDLTANPYTFQAKPGTTEARFLVRLNTAVTTVECVAYSQQNSPLFDLQGRPVTTPRPGIYLRNNRKVIIK